MPKVTGVVFWVVAPGVGNLRPAGSYSCLGARLMSLSTKDVLPEMGRNFKLVYSVTF